MFDFATARRTMVECQLRPFDIHDLPVLTAFDAVPRERFVPAGREAFAYIDQDVLVSEGLKTSERRFTLSPMVLGRMIEALAVTAGTTALDVACGLGYSSAVLAALGASVVALEADEALAAEARRRLAACGRPDVTVVAGPLNRGHAERAPYDAILVNGAVDDRPEQLLQQLDDGGRLVCVVGRGRAAKATLYVRAGDALGSRPLFDAAAPSLKAFQAEPGFVF
jgi:protein-L-isoaspartate(D-aspartate) O-methyltransferase